MRTLHTLVVSTKATRLQLRPLLESQPDVRVIAEVGTLAEARDVLAMLSVDLVVFESALGHEDGFELLPAIPLRSRVICLTGTTADAFRALGYGSLECVPMPVVTRVFVGRLEDVRRGHAIEPFPALEFA